MIGGVLSVIGIYLLVNIALLKVLPMSELSGATFPAADAARVIAGAHGRNLIILLSVISLVPLLNAITMMGTRVIFALGRDQLFWSRTSTVNRWRNAGYCDTINGRGRCWSHRNWHISAPDSNDIFLFGG